MNHSTSTTIRGTKEKQEVNTMRDHLALARYGKLSQQELVQLIYEEIYCKIPDDEIRSIYPIEIKPNSIL